jgi:hypothetical protein
MINVEKTLLCFLVLNTLNTLFYIFYSQKMLKEIASLKENRDYPVNEERDIQNILNNRLIEIQNKRYSVRQNYRGINGS